MNLPQFMSYVDDKTQKMTHEELGIFIHEFARKLSEVKRDEFLDLMNSISGADKSNACLRKKSDGRDELIEQINAIIPKLEKINSGEICLDSEYNEDWDDWYNSDADEILFFDPQKLLCDIQKAIDLIHQCLDMELFEYGYKLCEIVSHLEVRAEGDYSDYNGTPLSIEDLFDHDLISGDFANYAKEAMYLSYVVNFLGDRAEEMYHLFEQFSSATVKLEDILQMGNNELPEFDAFLHLWIEYLGMQKSKCASELLKEAQLMIKDESVLLENARKYVDVHPELYLQILQMKTKTGEEEKGLAVGLEAMDTVPIRLRIRSKIALQTAYYADKLCKFDVKENCWLEALRSDTSIMNYIRIKFLAQNSEQYNEKIWNIVESAFVESSKIKRDKYSYMDENMRGKYVSKKEYCTILFFEKHFDEMEKIGMSVEENLGWSSTFMKEGMALLLLLMYRGDTYREGMKAMLGRALRACDFKKETLYFGVDEASDKSDEDIFCNMFEKWRDTVSFSEAEKNKWMTKIDSWISRRVKGIMEANQRDYYGECASYIAAVGEALESQGSPCAKADIMEKYKTEYFRRSAFHKELRRYGMKK